MSMLLRKAHVAVVAIAMLFVVCTFAGCSKDGGTWGSPYTADYKVVAPNRGYAVIETTVKGPAAKLAVILTDPQGQSEHTIIEKDQMMSNSCGVLLCAAEITG